VKIVPGSIEDAESIAQVYLDAFPDSTAYYFPRKDRRHLLEVVQCGFQLVLLMGAQALVAVDDSGRTVGYCVFSSRPAGTARRPIPWLAAASLGLRALTRLSPPEIAKLAYGRILFRSSVRIEDKLPPEGGRIVSIAVRRSCQGLGLGRRLLAQTLTEMGPVPVHLEVRADNASALALYHGSGFRRYGLTRDGMGPWVIMVRPAPGGAEDPTSP